MDNFAEICSGKMVAIFECNIVFFGSIDFKPKEPFIFTSNGLRIVAHDELKMSIPMGHVTEVHFDFLSPTNSIIVIGVTTHYAAKIKESIKLAQKVLLKSDKNNFRGSSITLLCEKLSQCTKNVLRCLFSHSSDINEENAKKIRRILGVEKKNSEKLAASESSPNSLIKLNSSSLSSKDQPVAGSTLSGSELVSNDATCITVGTSTNKSSMLPEPGTTLSSTTAESADLPTSLENRQDSLSKDTECAATEEAPTESTSALVEISSDLNTIPSALENRAILLYQYNEGAITLTVDDYMCLTSGEYLNDTIIDFYMKYIQNRVIRTNRNRKKIHIFSTYFYHVLNFKDHTKDKTDKRSDAERRYDRVKNWTKNVNIFEKDFIFVPVNERLHWFLVVICFPNMVLPDNSKHVNTNYEGSDDTVKQPVILIFNSMAETANYRSTSILRDYLTCEYKTKMPQSANPPNFTKETIPGHRIKVPQQDNTHDCGLYVLQYVEEFLKNPIKDFRIPIKEISDWFDSMVIIRKREEIAKLIERLIDEHHENMGTRPNVKLPNIPFPTLNGELVSYEVPYENVPNKDVEMG